MEKGELENKEPKYKAKRKYRDLHVAQRYDRDRFSGPLGRMKLFRDRTLVSRALQEVGEIDYLLDLPTGTGRFIPTLEPRARKLVCADISGEMMQVAASVHPRERVSFIQCSVEELPFQDSSFDFTFTARFLLHLPPELRRIAFSELTRVSKRWVFFDCLMEGGFKGWLRRLFPSSIRKGGKAKKRMRLEDLERDLDLAGLRICRIFRPSRLFSEKWMILCERKAPNLSDKKLARRI